MLKKFQVSNYRNFRDTITIDFGKTGGYHFNQDCVTNQMISKMIIYGRNATGKTNLGEALFDIRKNLLGFIMGGSDKGIFLNADSNEQYAQFVYVFQFDNNEVTYKYRRSDEYSLADEELLLNDSRCFYCDYLTDSFTFPNLSSLDAETAVVDRFLQSLAAPDEESSAMSHTPAFLRWLINNTALQPNAVLLKLSDYVNRMSFMSANASLVMWPSKMIQKFIDLLEDPKELSGFETFLNAMGIEGKLVCEKTPDGRTQLYFKHEKLIPFFETASSGTMSAFNFYRRLKYNKVPSLLYLDEFDAFYHYEMSENVVRLLKVIFPQCQVIFTSHNTNLLTNRLLRPDCLFILSRTGQLTALCDATTRELREGHNLEKMYISGEFDRYE